MSLAGTRSSRGDIYQVCVAMDCAIRMIKDPTLVWMELDSTRVISGGMPAPVDDVILGWASGQETCCQCKKNQPGFTAWKVAELEEDLKKAAEHLMAEPNVEVRFYSRADFGDLGRLVERALLTPDLAAFRSDFPNALSAELTKLEAVWKDALAKGTHDVHALLRRIEFNLTRGLGELEAHLKLDLGQQVTRADDAYSALWTVLDGLGARTADPSLVAETHRITRSELLQILQDKGCAIAPPRAKADVEGKLKGMSGIGRQWRREIAGKRFERTAVADLRNAIDAGGSVLLTDGPGAGKTCVLLQLAEELEARTDVATLFLQARDYADATDHEGRVALGLDPDIPALVSAMSQWKRVVVIIDSLDVLSLNRETQCLTFFLNLIDRLRTIPDACVVVACRSFDLQYNWNLAGRRWDRTVEIGLLNWLDVVEPLLSGLGVDTAALDASTRGLLGNPRNLALFADVATRFERKSLSSAQELTDLYLDVVIAGDSNLGSPAMVAIETMATEMLTQRRHQLRRSRVQASDDLLRRLCSANVLFESGRGDVGFGHQTLLDALAVRDGVRRGLSLLEFIQSLQPVPFIRPAIRAFFAHLRSSNRSSFGAQVRSVFDSDVAFHIKRLIAESYAACEPDDRDWGLVRHLFRKHPEHFVSVYDRGHELAWHHFWMRHLVPMLDADGETKWLGIHFRKLQAWANDDPVGVFAFWTRLAASHVAKELNLRGQFSFVVRGFKHLEKVDAQALLESLLRLPSGKHDCLGDFLLQWARHDARGDALVWQSIAGDVPTNPSRDSEIEEKLNCDESSFKRDKDLLQRFADSDALLDLAVSALESWSRTLALGPYSPPRDVAEGPNNELREETSYSVTHSSHALRHVSPLQRLVGSIEAAILQRAKAHDGWWSANALRICLADSGALRYIGVLAMTDCPERNADAAKQFFADDRRLQLTDRYELGRLISAVAPFLGDAIELAEAHILRRLSEYEDRSKPWVEAERYELLTRIPVMLRSPIVTSTIARMAAELPPPDDRPHIYSLSGMVGAPFDADQLTGISDDALVALLDSSKNLGDWPRPSHELVGGFASVNRLLHSIASEAPRRFLNLLAQRWHDLPNQSKRAAFDGAAHYLRYRYGNVQNSAWRAKEDVDRSDILELLLVELERHPAFWAGTREGATALSGCALVASSDDHVARVAFLAPAHIRAEDPPCGERQDDDLIFTAINSSRGELADGFLSLANRLVEEGRELPVLLAPTLRRLAQDCHPAVRAVVARALAYMQTKSELGWELFDAAFSADDERVWKYAAQTLYYATGKLFARAKPYIDRMERSNLPAALKVWARLSALAVLEGQLGSHVLLEKLAQRAEASAWDGAISVWVANAGNATHASECFAGMTAAASHAVAHAPLLQRMSVLFREQSPVPRIPLGLFRSVYLNGGAGPEAGVNLPPGIDEWLSRFAGIDPDHALEIAEIIAGICKVRDATPFYDPKPLGALLTSLFREAEEREASDNGRMLLRVVALQDLFLSLPTSMLGEWLQAAERPDA